jgi:hypothetical protein
VRQLLSHVERVLTVLFGHASRFVKQLENRLSCFVEAVAWRKRDYGIFCHVQTPKFRTRWRFDRQNKEKATKSRERQPARAPDEAGRGKDRIGNGTAFSKISLLGNGGLRVGREGRIRYGAARG